jgi:thiamine pyrophosphokinase
VREYYTSLGVDVSQDRDVESTDFGKAMQKIAAAQPALRQREILILGTLGGRVDQGLRILHDIYRAELKNPSFRLWLLSEASVSFVLREGDNYIEGLKSGGFFTKYAGLIPIYGPATITTAGMEWDVSNWDTQMGGEHVSSSNHVVSDRVDVRTSGPILFTIERSESPRN